MSPNISPLHPGFTSEEQDIIKRAMCRSSNSSASLPILEKPCSRLEDAKLSRQNSKLIQLEDIPEEKPEPKEESLVETQEFYSPRSITYYEIERPISLAENQDALKAMIQSQPTLDEFMEQLDRDDYAAYQREAKLHQKEEKPLQLHRHLRVNRSRNRLYSI